jgi:uncharacterized protein
MILKVLLIIVIGFLAYILLFKKSREKDITKKNEKIEDEMVSCPTCKTYVSQKEAIVSNGQFYCSKECLLNK